MVGASLDLVEMLKVKMAYDGERQKVLAQNIANIDTPGYRASDLKPLSFENELAMETARVPLAVTSPMHMNSSTHSTGRFRTEISKNTFERTPTGGTVVIEEQMMKVAQNATDYQMTTSLYKKVGNLFRQALGLSPTA
jgi:flagellar basal-body rod protein FlgB